MKSILLYLFNLLFKMSLLSIDYCSIFYSKSDDNLWCSTCGVTFCAEELFDHICFITHCKHCGKMNCVTNHFMGCSNVGCTKSHCYECGECGHKAIDHCDWCDAIFCELNHCNECGYRNCNQKVCIDCNEKECSYYHQWSCVEDKGCNVCGELDCNEGHCFRCESQYSKCRCQSEGDDWCDRCDHSNAECVCAQRLLRYRRSLGND